MGVCGSQTEFYGNEIICIKDNKYYNNNERFICINGNSNVFEYNNSCILKGMKHDTTLIANIKVPRNGKF